MIASRQPVGNAVVVTVDVPGGTCAVHDRQGVGGSRRGQPHDQHPGRPGGSRWPSSRTRPALTTIGFKQTGERVNIETDMIGKYVERFLSTRTDAKPTGVTLELLARSGYLK